MFNAIFAIIIITVILYFMTKDNIAVIDNTQGELKRFDLSRLNGLEGEAELRMELLKAEAILRAIKQDAQFCVPLKRNESRGEILVPDVGAYSDDDRKTFGDVRITSAIPVHMNHYMLDKVNAIHEIVNSMFSKISLKYNIDTRVESVVDQYITLKTIIDVEKEVNLEFMQLKMDVVVACAEQKERLREIDPSLARYTMRSSTSHSFTNIPRYEFGKSKMMVERSQSNSISIPDRQLSSDMGTDLTTL